MLKSDLKGWKREVFRYIDKLKFDLIKRVNEIDSLDEVDNLKKMWLWKEGSFWANYRFLLWEMNPFYNKNQGIHGLNRVTLNLNISTHQLNGEGWVMWIKNTWRWPMMLNLKGHLNKQIKMSSIGGMIKDQNI